MLPKTFSVNDNLHGQFREMVEAHIKQYYPTIPDAVMNDPLFIIRVMRIVAVTPIDYETSIFELAVAHGYDNETDSWE